MTSNAFEGVDVFGGVHEEMEIFEKGRAPPEVAKFPDLFGPLQKTEEGAKTHVLNATTNAEKERAKSEDFDADSPKETVSKEAPSSSHDVSNSQSTSVVPMKSLRETVRPGVSKRTDFKLIREKACLLIIDVQKYLSQSEGPGFYQDSLESMFGNIFPLIEAFRARRDVQEQGCEVIFTFLQAMTNNGRDISLDYRLSGQKLANIPKINTQHEQLFLEHCMPELSLGKGDILIPKTSCSVFQSTNIDYLLRNLHAEQLVICGQLTDQCVESAVRDAADLGYFVTVVKDACAAQSAEAEEKGFHGMAGFCRTLSTQEVLAELAAQHTLASAVPSTLGGARDVGAVRAGEKLACSVAPTSKTFIGSEEAAYTSALLESLKAAGVEFLRYLIVDVCNTVRCKAAPLDQLLEKSTLNYQISFASVVVAGLPTFGDAVTEGTGLDASGVMIVQPDLITLRILPYSPKSAIVLGTIHDPVKGGVMSELCTRGLLQRVTKSAKDSFGIEFCIGCEIEFCLHLPSGKPVDNSIFCNSTTLNQQECFISDLLNQLKHQRIPVEAVHAESAPGQLEVVIAYQRDPVRLADYVLLAQETIRAVARKHSMKALLLPKIHATQAGNGLHLHLSFNDVTTSQNAFSSGGSCSLSGRGQSFLEGILEHLGGLLALTMPTSNSFRRVGPGCWTGSSAEWGVEDKESALRVCSTLHSQEWTHVEYKLNDSSANLYLALAGILRAGLDGIEKDSTLRPPRSNGNDSNAALPDCLEKGLTCLEEDSMLIQMMGPSLSQAYLALRRAEAATAANLTLEDELRAGLDRA